MENLNCGRCGKCCEVIRLDVSKSDLSINFKSQRYDADYIIKNWEEIPIEEFMKVNPWYFTQFKNRDGDLDIVKRGFFYKCNSFDTEKKICKDYINRPTVCKDYPIYPGSFDNYIIKGETKIRPDYILYSQECVFHKAKATKREWENRGGRAQNIYKK